MKLIELTGLIQEAVREAITEAKFNPEILSDRNRFPSFDDRLDFVHEKLPFLGEGSSRAAFVLDSKRALKLAMNVKGLAQNEAELDLVTNSKVSFILSKILAYDPRYKWVVSELVRPLQSQVEFKQLTGVSWQVFKEFVGRSLKAKTPWQNHVADVKSYLRGYVPESSVDTTIQNPWFSKTMEALSSSPLFWPDLLVIDHWGKTPDQRVVLLDYGYTFDVASQHYS